MSTENPRVSGLDLSLTATGVCDPDGNVFTIATDDNDGDRRLNVIRLRVLEVVQGNDFVRIEDLPTHAKSAGITAMVHGVVRADLAALGIPYARVVPSTLKKYASGKGSGDKTLMAMSAFKRAGVEFADDNQCDAWWLRAMCLDHLGHPLFELPELQRKSLCAVEWDRDRWSPKVPAVSTIVNRAHGSFEPIAGIPVGQHRYRCVCGTESPDLHGTKAAANNWHQDHKARERTRVAELIEREDWAALGLGDAPAGSPVAGPLTLVA
jgi:Holliday junction resolvasome RuvABC endonuclease subunit